MSARDERSIHRASEVTRILKAIESAPDGLSIIGVSGPGGVGKTYLLNHVFELLQPEKAGYLLLTASKTLPRLVVPPLAA